MKRLFAIKDTNTGDILQFFFNNKMAAKAKRDELNAANHAHPYVVTKGPDHDKVLRGAK